MGIDGVTDPRRIGGASSAGGAGQLSNKQFARPPRASPTCGRRRSSATGRACAAVIPTRACARALEDAWARFYESADAEGVHDLAGLISAGVRSLVVNGEALFLHVTTPRGEPRLRLLSPEQLDPAMTREVENMESIIAGVEFNAAGERIAYHIYRAAPRACRQHAVDAGARAGFGSHPFVRHRDARPSARMSVGSRRCSHGCKS